MKRVVVTGMGMVAPTGLNVSEAWANALDCKSGIGPISQFDASKLPVKIAGEVKGIEAAEYVDAKEVSRTTRFVLLSLAAAKEAIESSGIDKQKTGNRFGCSIGVGMGALRDIEETAMVLNDKGFKRVSPFFIPYAITNMAAGVVSIKYGLQGPNLCTTTACASGSHAIGEAFDLIQKGVADIMMAGGAEAVISPLGIASFNALKALSKQNDNPHCASRPFDKDRDGFVMGEGAGLLILEEYEHARKRGADIVCEIVGYGLSGDAHHITAPPPSHEGGKRCMAMALETGGISLDEVDYINAHGTSTKLNDLYESEAIKSLFGAHGKNLSVSSTKGVTGHCIGAAGGIEAVYTALALKNQLVPPTANLDECDTQVGLDYVAHDPKQKRIRYALSNSFGFGGTNATIALKDFR